MDQPRTKKSLGQHWLHDEASLQAIVDAVDVCSEDIVLEIGSGPGTLTKFLVERAQKVVAVEFDEQLARDLPARVPAENLEVVHQDILQFDFRALPVGYKVVANIPYYLTSNLIRVLSESANPPSHVALLIQKEVAERAAAGPGAMSLLSVSAQFYWEVTLGRKVLAELFTPPPKVDSQILILKRRAEPLFADVEPKQFFRLVKAGFSGKRKTLLNSLSAGLQLGKPEINELLGQANVTSGLRAQALSLDDWHRLYQVMIK
jgi:16S rRNA (adenine1518-N6/adenine1519-N6)-dimethyltransferase